MAREPERGGAAAAAGPGAGASARALRGAGASAAAYRSLGENGGRADARYRRLPELLAPAGGTDALLAAVAAGADAVYAGLDAFSARVSAENFSPAELERAARVAHAHGARVYVALNVQVREDELEAAIEAARTAVRAGADALIVADLGLAARIRATLPGCELHLSTQANVESPAGARLAAALGFARVTCARELSLPEIAALAQAGVEIEAFCHGAICISYAGCCELSAQLRGRSANRGACTQPCRFDWELLRAPADAGVAGGRDVPSDAWEPVGVADGPKLLCPRDFCSIDHVPELVRAGVAALKVEGRMKNPDYVYNVVRAYRRALDAAGEMGAEEAGAAGAGAGAGAPADAGAGEGAVAVQAPAALPYDAGELGFELGLSFNRGFTDAYLVGAPDDRMMSRERAINQGARVGVLRARDGRAATIMLERPVSAGDTLEIRFYPDESAKVHGPKRWPMVPCPRDAAAGEDLVVSVKRKVEPPCEVYCVRSARVLSETERALAPLRAELADAAAEKDAARGAAAGACGDPPAARALAARRANGVRQAASALGAPVEAERAGAKAGDEEAAAACGCRRVAGAGSADAAKRGGAARAVLARTPEEARAARAAGARVYALSWKMAEEPDAWTALAGEVAVVLDEMLHPGEESAVRGLMGRAGAVVCRNLGQVALAREAGAPFEVMAPLAARNSAAALAFAEMGARVVWLSPELSADELARLAAGWRAAGRARGARLGVLALAWVEAMVCAHCVLRAEGPCSGRCASCARRSVPHALRGTDGALALAATDARGRTRVFARPRTSVAAACAALEARGVSPAVLRAWGEDVEAV